ncbi:phosphoribosyltransferase [Haloprofundus marisrubri]|uniref:Phosphoribosyltransferase n=1 Tax=Haloprofundus marisrubri TaxID=1514971 RepID=A0A0W1R3K4_9EURY|nr:phosphoribosyltransferase family protein [Haloprofundus marisrubri]KTG07892.1 phosphoribosyltransferase [Haloprofundus marisrubri]
MRFTNRTEAGERVADALERRGVDADLVLAIPRGALPVGRVVADRLGAPLDVVVAEKLGAPRNPELAIGAVAGDGSVWLNDELVDRLGISSEYVERVRETEAENAREKVASYRGGEAVPEMADKRVVLVDDGVATGATAIACLRQLRNAGAAHVTLAVPVAPADAKQRLAEELDTFVCVEAPSSFGAVGQYYRSFGQVSNEEARAILRESQPR